MVLCKKKLRLRSGKAREKYNLCQIFRKDYVDKVIYGQTHEERKSTLGSKDGESSPNILSMGNTGNQGDKEEELAWGRGSGEWQMRAE